LLAEQGKWNLENTGLDALLLGNRTGRYSTWQIPNTLFISETLTATICCTWSSWHSRPSIKMLHRLWPKIKREIEVGIDVLTMMLDLYSAGCTWRDPGSFLTSIKLQYGCKPLMFLVQKKNPGFCYTDFPFFPWPTMYSDHLMYPCASGRGWSELRSRPMV